MPFLKKMCICNGFKDHFPLKKKIVEKKSHYLHNLSHDGPYPENIGQFLIFYRTLSEALIQVPFLKLNCMRI